MNFIPSEAMEWVGILPKKAWQIPLINSDLLPNLPTHWEDRQKFNLDNFNDISGKEPSDRDPAGFPLKSVFLFSHYFSSNFYGFSSQLYISNLRILNFKFFPIMDKFKAKNNSLPNNYNNSFYKNSYSRKTPPRIQKSQDLPVVVPDGFASLKTTKEIQTKKWGKSKKKIPLILDKRDKAELTKNQMQVAFDFREKTLTCIKDRYSSPKELENPPPISPTDVLSSELRWTKRRELFNSPVGHASLLNNSALPVIPRMNGNFFSGSAFPPKEERLSKAMEWDPVFSDNSFADLIPLKILKRNFARKKKKDICAAEGKKIDKLKTHNVAIPSTLKPMTINKKAKSGPLLNEERTHLDLFMPHANVREKKQNRQELGRDSIETFATGSNRHQRNYLTTVTLMSEGKFKKNRIMVEIKKKPNLLIKKKKNLFLFTIPTPLQKGMFSMDIPYILPPAKSDLFSLSGKNKNQGYLPDVSNMSIDQIHISLISWHGQCPAKIWAKVLPTPLPSLAYPRVVDKIRPQEEGILYAVEPNLWQWLFFHKLRGEEIGPKVKYILDSLFFPPSPTKKKKKDNHQPELGRDSSQIPNLARIPTRVERFPSIVRHSLSLHSKLCDGMGPNPRWKETISQLISHWGLPCPHQTSNFLNNYLLRESENKLLHNLIPHISNQTMAARIKSRFRTTPKPTKFKLKFKTIPKIINIKEPSPPMSQLIASPILYLPSPFKFPPNASAGVKFILHQAELETKEHTGIWLFRNMRNNLKQQIEASFLGLRKANSLTAKIPPITSLGETTKINGYPLIAKDSKMIDVYFQLEQSVNKYRMFSFQSKISKQGLKTKLGLFDVLIPKLRLETSQKDHQAPLSPPAYNTPSPPMEKAKLWGGTQWDIWYKDNQETKKTIINFIRNRAKNHRLTFSSRTSLFVSQKRSSREAKRQYDKDGRNEKKLGSAFPHMGGKTISPVHFTALSRKPELAIKGVRLPFTMGRDSHGQRLPVREGKVYCMQSDPKIIYFKRFDNSFRKIPEGCWENTYPLVQTPIFNALHNKSTRGRKTLELNEFNSNLQKGTKEQNSLQIASLLSGSTFPPMGGKAMEWDPEEYWKGIDDQLGCAPMKYYKQTADILSKKNKIYYRTNQSRLGIHNILEMRDKSKKCFQLCRWAVLTRPFPRQLGSKKRKSFNTISLKLNNHNKFKMTRTKLFKTNITYSYPNTCLGEYWKEEDLAWIYSVVSLYGGNEKQSKMNFTPGPFFLRKDKAEFFNSLLLKNSASLDKTLASPRGEKQASSELLSTRPFVQRSDSFTNKTSVSFLGKEKTNNMLLLTQNGNQLRYIQTQKAASSRHIYRSLESSAGSACRFTPGDAMGCDPNILWYSFISAGSIFLSGSAWSKMNYTSSEAIMCDGREGHFVVPKQNSNGIGSYATNYQTGSDVTRELTVSYIALGHTPSPRTLLFPKGEKLKCNSFQAPPPPLGGKAKFSLHASHDGRGRYIVSGGTQIVSRSSGSACRFTPSEAMGGTPKQPNISRRSLTILRRGKILEKKSPQKNFLKNDIYYSLQPSFGVLSYIKVHGSHFQISNKEEINTTKKPFRLRMPFQAPPVVSGSAFPHMGGKTISKVQFTRRCDSDRIANETRRPESLPFTMGRRSAPPIMGGEGVLYVVGPKHQNNHLVQKEQQRSFATHSNYSSIFRFAKIEDTIWQVKPLPRSCTLSLWSSFKMSDLYWHERNHFSPSFKEKDNRFKHQLEKPITNFHAVKDAQAHLKYQMVISVFKKEDQKQASKILPTPFLSPQWGERKGVGKILATSHVSLMSLYYRYQRDNLEWIRFYQILNRQGTLKRCHQYLLSKKKYYYTAESFSNYKGRKTCFRLVKGLLVSSYLVSLLSSGRNVFKSRDVTVAKYNNVTTVRQKIISTSKSINISFSWIPLNEYRNIDLRLLIKKWGVVKLKYPTNTLLILSKKSYDNNLSGYHPSCPSIIGQGFGDRRTPLMANSGLQKKAVKCTSPEVKRQVEPENKKNLVSYQLFFNQNSRNLPFLPKSHTSVKCTSPGAEFTIHQAGPRKTHGFSTPWISNKGTPIINTSIIFGEYFKAADAIYLLPVFQLFNSRYPPFPPKSQPSVKYTSSEVERQAGPKYNAVGLKSLPSLPWHMQSRLFDSQNSRNYQAKQWGGTQRVIKLNDSFHNGYYQKPKHLMPVSQSPIEIFIPKTGFAFHLFSQRSRLHSLHDETTHNKVIRYDSKYGDKRLKGRLANIQKRYVSRIPNLRKKVYRNYHFGISLDRTYILLLRYLYEIKRSMTLPSSPSLPMYHSSVKCTSSGVKRWSGTWEGKVNSWGTNGNYRFMKKRRRDSSITNSKWEKFSYLDESASIYAEREHFFGMNELKFAMESSTCLISEFYLEPLFSSHRNYLANVFSSGTEILFLSPDFSLWDKDDFSYFFPPIAYNIPSPPMGKAKYISHASPPNRMVGKGGQTFHIEEKAWNSIVSFKKWYEEIYNLKNIWHFISFKFDIIISKNLNHFRNARYSLKENDNSTHGFQAPLSPPAYNTPSPPMGKAKFILHWGGTQPKICSSMQLNFKNNNDSPSLTRNLPFGSHRWNSKRKNRSYVSVYPTYYGYSKLKQVGQSWIDSSKKRVEILPLGKDLRYIVNLDSSNFDAFQINTFNQIYFINAVASLNNASKSSDITQGVPLLKRYFDLPKDSPIHFLLKQTFEKYYSYGRNEAWFSSFKSNSNSHNTRYSQTTRYNESSLMGPETLLFSPAFSNKIKKTSNAKNSNGIFNDLDFSEQKRQILPKIKWNPNCFSFLKTIGGKDYFHAKSMNLPSPTKYHSIASPVDVLFSEAEIKRRGFSHRLLLENPALSILFKPRLSFQAPLSPPAYNIPSPPMEKAKYISHASHDGRGRYIVSGETQMISHISFPPLGEKQRSFYSLFLSGSPWCKMNFTPGKAMGWNPDRVANETRPSTLYNGRRSAPPRMGGEGILYAVGPKKKLSKQGNGVKSFSQDFNLKYKNSYYNRFTENQPKSNKSTHTLLSDYAFSSYKLRTVALKYSLIKILQKIVNNVQAVYRGQGVEIYDQHIEVLVSQMGSKIRVKEDFDSKFFWNEIVPLNLIKDSNIEFEPIICGITKISLQTDSFISSSSFQNASKILSQESLKKSKDFIFGLKESIIVSELIPSGTGVFINTF